MNKNKTLLDTYSKFTTVKTSAGELRAGSAEAIRATVQELYRTVLAQERYGEDDEVKKVAEAIRVKIDSYFDVYFAEPTSTTPFAGTPVASGDVNKQTTPGIYNYDLEYFMPYLKFNSTDKAIYNFPTYQGLPSGVVNLQCTQNDNGCTFSYKTTSTAVLSAGNAVTNFTFPAELTYFANSALRASNYSKEANDYPNTGSWDDNTKWNEKTEPENTQSDWAGTEVTADTRAVAMKNKIFYGVSRLQSNVKLGFTSGTELEDNREHLFNDGKTKDQRIEIGDKSFILTGILVGQQPDEVGWNFLSKDNAFNKVVYDRILPTGADTYYTYPEYPTNAYNLSAGSYNFVTTTGTAPNYTLLLDNLKSGDTQDDVSVALEFINNTGKDFYGRDNVIPAGGTFYLVGKLKLESTAAIDFDAQYGTDKNIDYKTRIPGFGTKRVFIQDHTTVAHFTIGIDALKKAYNTIPDLRTVQMLFGLTVDMEWRSGITYNDVPLNQ